MADEDQPGKAAKASGKAPTRRRRATETKSRTQTKRAASTRRTPLQAEATAQPAKGAPSPEKTEAGTAAREASETSKQRDERREAIGREASAGGGHCQFAMLGGALGTQEE